MAEIKKLKNNSETIYPITVPQAVIDPITDRSIRTDLDTFANELAAKAGISSVVQTITSDVDGGTNVIRCTLDDGTITTFQVKNGNQGNSGYTGAAGELEVVNNLTDGGATKALSAEQGRYLYKNSVEKKLLSPTEVINNYYFDLDGHLIENQFMRIQKYSVDSKSMYFYSAETTTDITCYLIGWFDSQNNLLLAENRSGEGHPLIYEDQLLVSPENASYVYINTLKSKDETVSFKSTNLLNLDDINKRSYTKVELTPFSTINKAYFSSSGELVTSSSWSIRKFNVIPGETYYFSGIMNNGWSAVNFVGWFDNNGELVQIEPYKGLVEYKDKMIVAPENGTQLWENVYKYEVDSFNIKNVNLVTMENVLDDLDQLNTEINNDYTEFAEVMKQYVQIDPTSITENTYLTPGGVFTPFNGINLAVYDIEEDASYYVSGKFRKSITVNLAIWTDSLDSVLKVEPYKGSMEESVSYNRQLITAPIGASKLYVNVDQRYNSYFKLENLGDFIKINELTLLNDSDNKLMKVVINKMTGYNINDAFYIRTKYNLSKDIIITHLLNENGIVTFKSAYIGPKQLSDLELMTNKYRVSEHADSTAPLFFVKEYWHLFAQHGYPIPTISNSVNMDNSDIGAVWKDQLNRRYTIGNVENNKIYLLPEIYKDASGKDIRDWKSPNSDAIISLEHVSGGSYTNSFDVSNYGYMQIRPIMDTMDRKYVADDKEIINTGTYYCDKFSISETTIGYDPASISVWFPTPDLSNALEMAKFTFSFNYCGAQCSCNTTIDIKKEVCAQGYGAIQQQFFIDNGEYKAMFMLPKVASQGGKELDKPFNSPSLSSTSYDVFRTTARLKNINDPLDRCIGFLYNESKNDYLVGMASGLSLVSGDTIKSKRVSELEIGDNNNYYRLCHFSPPNNNKFYLMAFNTAKYEDNGYYLPEGWFKEINFYVSYFDPSENVGQVYWYKDGNKYIIYCHCQSEQHHLAINVPDLMEGLSLSIVEKTDDVELLTETIQNGKFIVNYNSNNANYIVLVAK